MRCHVLVVAPGRACDCPLPRRQHREARRERGRGRGRGTGGRVFLVLGLLAALLLRTELAAAASLLLPA